MITIVLYKPEKPANVGNIIRTCIAFDLKLAIVGELTFSLTDKDFLRAKMDYGVGFPIKRYETFEEFEEDISPNSSIYTITRYSNKVYSSFDFSHKDDDKYFVFGSESKGLPKEFLLKHKECALRIPMTFDSRSLNLSNCVAIISSECLRQQNFNNLAKREVIKGANFIFDD